jgi:cytoskeletal protein RodZ
MSERGAIKLSVVLAAVLGVGFIASGYLNFAQHQQSVQEQSLLQGQITDLTYQLKQNQGTNSPSPSPASSSTSSSSPIPSPSSSPAVAGTASLSISQFGVSFTVNDPIVDLTYAPEQSGSYTVAAFTTQSLLAKYPACKPGVLGSLVRKPKNASASYNDKLIKAIGNFNYYYVQSYSYCATDTAGSNIVAADRAAVENSALPTLAQ